jgi:hypothetical protein
LLFCLSSGNETFYSDQGRVKLQPHDNVPNIEFVIEDATMDDRGDYRCIATSVNNYTNSATTYVRVKGEECIMLKAVCFIFHVIVMNDCCWKANVIRRK